MESMCPNCKSNFEVEHFFCPSCGFDLRNNSTTTETISKTKTELKRKSIIDILGSPGGSISISLIVGTITMDMINGYYRYLGSPKNDTASLIGAILGGGVGFLIIAAGPALVISLIFLAINKKFPKDGFVTMLYIFTVIVSWFFLSTLYK